MDYNECGAQVDISFREQEREIDMQVQRRPINCMCSYEYMVKLRCTNNDEENK